MSLERRTPGPPGRFLATRWSWHVLALLWAASGFLPSAGAETRAWLDRPATSRGEAVTLNIETDQRGVAPDYTPLQADFALGPPYRNAPAAGGWTLFGIALTPRGDGSVQVPSLQVGAERTPPLVLEVASVGAAGTPRGDVFVESRVDVPSPFVQQSVGLTVRLYYATPLLSGELSQDVPPGASLQRIGDDVQSSRQIGDRRYQVVERRYLLVPEASGRLDLPPARFRGRGAGGFFDDFFGTDRVLSAQGTPLSLQVRAQPGGAPQPWLPLRGLRLRYLAAPAQARSGESVEIVVEAVAQGVTAAQFPEIPPPRIDGAQVFAERAENTERFVDGGPQLTTVRRFSVVPLRPGVLRVPGPRMQWWDAAADGARDARLPDLELQVAAGAPRPASAPVGGGAEPAAAPATSLAPLPAGGAGPVHRWPWSWLALVFAALWLLTLAMLLATRRTRAVAPATSAGASAPPLRPPLSELRRELDVGSLEEVVRVLERMATPPLTGVDEAIARLDDPAQREALDAMRRALWAGEGEPARARAALRAAFRDGPRWRTGQAPSAVPLPPLYPPG